MPYSQADYAKPVTFPRDEQEEQQVWVEHYCGLLDGTPSCALELECSNDTDVVPEEVPMRVAQPHGPLQEGGASSHLAFPRSELPAPG